MVLRKSLPTWAFQILNLTFISATQNVLLLLLGFPAAIASALQPHDELSTSDVLLAILALVILALEFIADNQQYTFQSFKHAYLAREKGNSSAEPYDEKKHWLGARLAFTPADAKRGFVTRGLWAWSRHPNCTCEMSFWVCRGIIIMMLY
jgi:steroid 5-alpha reductase family enzyme